jgi:hypothetical protein
MNIDMLAQLARLRTEDLLSGAEKRRALTRDRKPDRRLLVAIVRAIRSFGRAAVQLGDALATRVL